MLSIIIPTYNERETILSTIKSVLKVIPKNTLFEIIIVDDDSPDKTWDLVNKKFSKKNNIYALRRTKSIKGLSPSVINGFNHAKGDYFLVMDADGQHDQTKIPEMLKHIKNNDIVLGSRFVPGGSVKGWSKKRIFISKIAALMAKPLLYSEVSDPMSGFFMIQKKTFDKVKNKINPQGYKIMLDILFALPKATIHEVAYHFGIRKRGESKLGSKVIVNYILMLIKQIIKKYNKFIKFCFVGASGVVINLGLLYILTEFASWYYLVSSAFAIEVSIISNFLLNNWWTWKKKKKGFISRFFKFNLVSLIALVMNMSILFFFTEIIGLWYILSNLIGIAIATIVNFSLNDRWTFKK